MFWTDGMLEAVAEEQERFPDDGNWLLAQMIELQRTLSARAKEPS